MTFSRMRLRFAESRTDRGSSVVVEFRNVPERVLGGARQLNRKPGASKRSINSAVTALTVINIADFCATLTLVRKRVTRVVTSTVPPPKERGQRGHSGKPSPLQSVDAGRYLRLNRPHLRSVIGIFTGKLLPLWRRSGAPGRRCRRVRSAMAGEHRRRRQSSKPRKD
jgi:hypothetical protein